MSRLATLGGLRFSEVAELRARSNPDPKQALINLERWLTTTSSPGIYAEQFQLSPDRLETLLLVVGASQPLADTIIQNPEFGSLFLDKSEIGKRASVAELIVEGQKLLQSATSPSHALDRIRYLRQRHNLLISINDLTGAWPQEHVWEALSDLADAIVKLTLDSAWTNFIIGKQLPQTPPIGIVAFGKFGARELNYSSDLDLAYVLESGVDERTERECTKFCGVFGRALSDRMGRGALYRVDLRLRPFGSQGPLLASIASVVTYYRLYAEAWEVQALIKSRAIVGVRVQDEWIQIKEERAFASSLSDASLAEVLNTRARIEEYAGEEDLKRGPGGIRDVEFLCQTLQLVSGPTHPQVRLAATCDAIRALAEEHLIESSLATILIDGYTFMRKLEHRIQLLGDRQTHSFPSDLAVQHKLSILMGFDNASALRHILGLHRKSVRSLYKSLLKHEDGFSELRERLLERVTPDGSSFLQWFDALPDPDAYYRSLGENEESVERVKTILRFAPKLIQRFKTNLNLTDALISGEIEWSQEIDSRWESLSIDAPEKLVSDIYTNAVSTAEAQWVLNSEIDLAAFLATTTNALLRYCVRRFDVPFHIIALGSFGSGQQSVSSDIDLLFLSESNHQTAELSAQSTINFLLQLKRYGFEPNVDLRLRPDGQKGLLVRSFDGFGSYEVGDMEMWERFALGSARLVWGSVEALLLVRRAAYANALTTSRLSELEEMKTRIETERLKPQHLCRNIKLGHGGLNDLEWIVHLYEMRDPHRAVDGSEPLMIDRLRNLGRVSLLNAFEVDSLVTAFRHLAKLRIWIALLEFPLDLVPENPNKLDRLAAAFGLNDGNEFLRLHEPIASWVRGFLKETFGRVTA